MSDVSPTGELSADDATPRPDPASAVATTLRELGLQLDEWAAADQVPPDTAPFTGSALGAGDGLDSALLQSLGIDAVIDTNATVSQPSLQDFLR